MTTKEFSLEFDILYNNIMSDIAPSLNEYEKSVFLTQAQESVVLDIYTGRFNADSFEKTEEVTQYIKELIVTDSPTLQPNQANKISRLSYLFKIPHKYLFVIYEGVSLDREDKCSHLIDTMVVPASHDEIHKLIRNPFKGPSNSRVLRLTHGNSFELISKFPIKAYTIRYLRSPKPIILEDLEEYSQELDEVYSGLHIGEDELGNPYFRKQECELNPALHRAILLRAVSLAKAVWNSGK